MDDFYEKLGRILGSYLDDEEYFNENYKVNNFFDKKTESRIPDPLNEEPKPVKLIEEQAFDIGSRGKGRKLR